VTPFPHLLPPFWTFTALYLFLGVAVVYYLLFRHPHRFSMGSSAASVGGSDATTEALLGGVSDGRALCLLRRLRRGSSAAASRIFASGPRRASSAG
jgi:hypothetical protein